MGIVRTGRRKRGLRAGAASLVIASMLLAGQSAQARIRTPLVLLVSSSADRTEAVPLNGTVISESVAIFVPRARATTSVSYFLDAASSPTRIDTTAPYDLMGSDAQGKAKLLDTTKLAVGAHKLTAVRVGTSGAKQTVEAEFRVVREATTGSTTGTAPGLEQGLGGGDGATAAGGGADFPIFPILLDGADGSDGDAIDGTTPTSVPTATITTAGPTGTTAKPASSTTTSASANAKHIYLGAAVEPGQLDDAKFVAALKKYKFDSLTPENAMKFGPIEPDQGKFNWAGADKIVNFAKANGMRVRGHTLNWYIEIPGWVNGLSNEQAKAAMKNHIQQVMGRYKGKIAEWDVVNEAFNDDGSLRDDAWKQKLGNDYIAMCFQWAHEADPSAKLFYNDYSMESFDAANGGKAAKAQAVLDMVKDFKARGIPIDGVGFQTHSSGEYPGTGPAIKAMMQKLGQLGVQVEVTELDVKDHGDEASKAKRYGDIGAACAQAGNCTGVTTWGLYDGHTWLPGQDPLMLDGAFNAKPSYAALTKAIGRT